jgi:hypothetical protein
VRAFRILPLYLLLAVVAAARVAGNVAAAGEEPGWLLATLTQNAWYGTRGAGGYVQAATWAQAFRAPLLSLVTRTLRPSGENEAPECRVVVRNCSTGYSGTGTGWETADAKAVRRRTSVFIPGISFKGFDFNPFAQPRALAVSFRIAMLGSQRCPI